MASDGCQAPDWKASGAFSHLMHHPRTPASTESALQCAAVQWLCSLQCHSLTLPWGLQAIGRVLLPPRQGPRCALALPHAESRHQTLASIE